MRKKSLFVFFKAFKYVNVKDGRVFRSVGTVKHVDPDRPQYVILHHQKYYRRVLQNFTRRWTLMISNDTQSPSEDSISQSY